MNQLRRNLLAAIPAFAFGGNFLKLSAAETHKYLSTSTARMLSSFDSNPALPTILKGWEGTPQDSSGRYINHEFPHDNNIFRAIDWQMHPSPTRREKKEDTFKLRVVHDDSFLKSDYDCIVWFGHATFYIRLGGVSFLTDPVFGNLFMRDRLCKLPISPEYLHDLDAVLLSHVHMDHADEPSFNYLRKRNLQTNYLCGLQAGEVIADWTGSSRIQQAGWYQQYDMTRLQGGRSAEVFYLPARHWSRRGVFDGNKQLWGSFVIRANGKTIFWGGDSGYGSHFAQVKHLFGKVDLCIAGVGAYKPEWFMGQNHTSPTNAVRAAEDMSATRFVPMHYGTYDLADEAPGDPVRTLEALRTSAKSTCQIEIPHVGEIVRI